MVITSVPPLEPEGLEWPSLGPYVVRAIEDNLVFGPGDLFGRKAIVDPEKRALICRMYEVHPPGAVDSNGKSIAGRRRFRRCALSLQKGSAKTELAAWIGILELWHRGPVRCRGFDEQGRPIPVAVHSPYIPFVAYTEEQAEDLAYSVAKAILERSAIANDFDIGYERITRAGDASSKLVAVAGSPNSRDGAKTTFEHFDETHRWTSSRLKQAHGTMLANLTKLLIAEPWGLETTTAYSPGEGSVAEETADYAAQVEAGKIPFDESKLFYFHRQARDGYEWEDPIQRREALVEAAGPNAAWKDIDGISSLWQAPRADRPYLERVYGNRPISTAAQAFNSTAWAANMRPDEVVAPGRLITIGFDGSKSEDSTWAVGCDVETGLEWPIGHWDKPEGPAGDEWYVPEGEVDDVIAEAMRTYEVELLYADPSKWGEALARWANRFGPNRRGRARIVKWPTTLYRKTAESLKRYALDIEGGLCLNNGDPLFAQHVGNAQRAVQNFRDEDGSPLWLIRKDRPGSAHKIDGAMAGLLAWQARLDALAAGAKPRGPSVPPGYGDDDEARRVHLPTMAGIRRRDY